MLSREERDVDPHAVVISHWRSTNVEQTPTPYQGKGRLEVGEVFEHDAISTIADLDWRRAGLFLGRWPACGALVQSSWALGSVYL